MRPQRARLTPLAAIAFGLVACQFGQGGAAVPSVSSAPPVPEVVAVSQQAPGPAAVAIGLRAGARSQSAAEIQRVAEAIQREAAHFELAPDLAEERKSSAIHLLGIVGLQ